jgi:hypothetical protein
MNRDLSILVPGIRPHNWLELYNSSKKACTKYNYEMVFIGPFDPPDELLENDNVKYFKDFASVPVCMQKASLECEGKLIFHTVDDGVLEEHSIDMAIDYYNKYCSEKDVVNMRYREGVEKKGKSLPLGYWTAWYHGDLRLRGIDSSWSISVQPMMSLEYYKELGGFDCHFEYSNHCHHDLMFRTQMNGGKIYNSPVEVCNANHFPGKTGDHEPIFIAQHHHDDPKFFKLYGYKKPVDRIKIDYNNWKKCPEIWKIRFKDEKLPESYEEMLKE